MFIQYFFIAVAMGLDVFSVSLSLGMQRLSKRRIIGFSIIVGFLHSIFPYLGIKIGHLIIRHFLLYTSHITGLLFLCLGTYMVLAAYYQKSPVFIRGHWLSLLSLSVAVSLDSLTIGIGLSFAHQSPWAFVLLFGLVVMVMSIAGIIIGKRVTLIARKYSEWIGGLILILLGIYYFIY